MRRQISLYNEKAEEFDKIKEAMEDRLGYEPSNTDVVQHLIMHYDGPISRDPPLFE